MAIPRSPGEYLILISLICSLGFWGYLAAMGSWRFQGHEAVAIAQIAIVLGLGAAALWLLFRKRMAGALLSAVFYGIQILDVTLSSGRKIGFNSLPAVYFRVAGDKEAPVNVNVVALILFAFALLLFFAYRDRRRA